MEEEGRVDCSEVVMAVTVGVWRVVGVQQLSQALLEIAGYGRRRRAADSGSYGQPREWRSTVSAATIAIVLATGLVVVW